MAVLSPPPPSRKHSKLKSPHLYPNSNTNLCQFLPSSPSHISSFGKTRFYTRRKLLDWTWTITPLNTFVTFDWQINGILWFYVHITRKNILVARPVKAYTIDDSINNLIGIGLWQFSKCTWQVIILSALVDIINKYMERATNREK